MSITISFNNSTNNQVLHCVFPPTTLLGTVRSTIHFHRKIKVTAVITTHFEVEPLNNFGADPGVQERRFDERQSPKAPPQ